VKNPNKKDETAIREPKDILKEIKFMIIYEYERKGTFIQLYNKYAFSIGL
jgi:hypothetical protein